jgi:hypothetical protein
MRELRKSQSYANDSAMKSRQTVRGERVEKELLGEQSKGLLQELHLLTREGHLNADARRKLKQVNHLYNLIHPALQDLAGRYEDFTLVDVGAGKAYLGFILYELFFGPTGKGQVISVESRSELVNKGREMARRLGFERMRFLEGEMEKAELPERIHCLTALHACDTATDDALFAGVKTQADYIAVVPCCQAEAAQLLKTREEPAWSELWNHGIHRREFGSHLTNVLRALSLESLGYQVTVTELVGWEHSLKNEFILAKRVHRENKAARARLEDLLKKVGIRPKIIRLLFPT